MKPKGKKAGMLIPTIIMGLLAAVLVSIGIWRGQGEHIAGLKSATTMTWQVLPLLLFAFIAAGMIQSLIPGETIAKWVGDESGIKGILIGTFAGGLTPGGPYVSLPIVAGLMKSGAGVGTLVAYLTGWSLIALARLPMEVGILGWRFTMIRLISTIMLAPVAGLIAQWVNRLMTTMR